MKKEVEKMIQSLKDLGVEVTKETPTPEKEAYLKIYFENKNKLYERRN